MLGTRLGALRQVVFFRASPSPARDLRIESPVVLFFQGLFSSPLEAAKIINLPIAKHHSLTGTTLGMKNWYGILRGQRHYRVLPREATWRMCY